MKARIYSNVDRNMSFNRKMGKIGIELLTKAAICGATVGLIAGMAAAILAHLE